MVRPVSGTQSSTGAAPGNDSISATLAVAAWKTAVEKEQPATSNASVSTKAQADASSGAPLRPSVRYALASVVSPATVPLRVPNRQIGPDDGSPERAKDGAAAAQDLLRKDNPYFYNRILFRTDPSYDPGVAKAQSLAATLSNYEQKGDNANIALLLKTLGPDEAANLLSKAGNLQGPQVNSSGTVYAQNQADVDRVLANALLAPGVQLGEGSQQGTLASSLLKQAAASGSDTLSIAGILNASGSPKTEALKQQFLDGILVSGKALGTPSFDQASYADAARKLVNGDPALLSRYAGGIGVQKIFGPDGVAVPDPDRRLLDSLNNAIDTNLYGINNNGKSGKPGDPVINSISISTMTEIRQYLAGKDTKGEPSSQLLANMMSVLGPDRTYAVLSQMSFDKQNPLKSEDIQNSLNTLTETGQFTADDAKALALAQAKFARSASGNYGAFDLRDLGSVGSFIDSLPASANATAVKTAYAEGCITGVQQLSQDIASGKYSGQALNQLTDTLNSLSGNAANVTSNAPVQVKARLFSELHAAATQFAGRGDQQEADALNAYAAGLLSRGSPEGQSQIAKTLRAMGGVGADGAIAQDSELAKFLLSALRGQAEFGFGLSKTAPNEDIPEDVTHLLNGIAASGDTKLMAGTLDTVMQWTMKNPKQAEALAAQDSSGGAPGYREALTSLLDKSFNQVIALDPVDPNAKLVRTMQPQMLADLQALSAIEMGPPYDSKTAGDFASVIGKHSVEFAAYAQGKVKDPALDSLFAGIGDRADATQRNASAVVFGQIMNAFGAGLNQSQASAQKLAANADLAAAINQLQARIVTDYLRGAGTGLLLASTPVGLAAGKGAETLLSVFGRVGLFSGSLGTLFLDQGQLGDTVTEGQAIQAVQQGMKAADLTPTLAMQQLYNGWFSTLSQAPGGGNQGDENQEVLNGVMTGSSFATAAMVQTYVQDFYNAYDPMGYYHGLTGQNPPVG